MDDKIKYITLISYYQEKLKALQEERSSIQENEKRLDEEVLRNQVCLEYIKEMFGEYKEKKESKACEHEWIEEVSGCYARFVCKKCWVEFEER